MHIEAGLRSFNIFKPFPEEINRLITFRLSQYYACPGDWAIENLKKFKGEKINTLNNTQADTISFGMKNCETAKAVIPAKKFVVVSIHRYENIFKKERFIKIVDEIIEISKDFQVLFVQHPATFGQIDKLGLREKLTSNKNIKLLPRLEYLPFVKTVKHSEFVITDGGGNQEELYYMGKPTLIFRNETERQEGLGTTAVVSKFDTKTIKDFVKNYKKYEHHAIAKATSPSKIIVDFLGEKEFNQ